MPACSPQQGTCEQDEGLQWVGALVPGYGLMAQVGDAYDMRMKNMVKREERKEMERERHNFYTSVKNIIFVY